MLQIVFLSADTLNRAWSSDLHYFEPNFYCTANTIVSYLP
ncbi:hypothetical protein O3G_MSEX002869 [Manduca sexta]|uniref:Uncharacterized protein n=1 Tax=Manduca sexta TaxID=7130 RepID=A0A921YQ98_MANSE|nr:hypothetical protein O3G_MSEX002869 [Manduca sexta]